MIETNNRAKCIQLASDVLFYLKSKHFIPNNGYLIESVKGDGLDLDSVRNNIKSLLKQGSCYVCGIGSLIACNLMRYKTKLSYYDLDSAFNAGSIECLMDDLMNIFSESQVCMIEYAYEGSLDNCSIITSQFFDKDNSNDNEELKSRCLKFNSRYKTSRTRMIGIMKNIIRNQGEFIP